MIYADKQNETFLDDRVHVIPAGAVPLDVDGAQSHAIHRALVDALHAGQSIDWSGDLPVVCPAPVLTVAQRLAILKTQARAQLEDNDRVFARCGKAGVSYPPAWLAYDQALREIVRADVEYPGDLPERPAYPAGT